MSLTPTRCQHRSRPDAETIEDDPRRSTSITATDMAAMAAVLPSLDGDWQCYPVVERGGERYAVVARSRCWVPHQEDFIITRRGEELRLMVTHRPFGPSLLGVFDDIEPLCQVLRRSARLQRRASALDLAVL